MDTLQAILLGIVQGITEFLPVSSSGHLQIAKELLGVELENNITFDVTLHAATVLSTIVVLWQELWRLVKGCFSRRFTEEQAYVLKVILSMIPAGVVGVLFADQIEALFSLPSNRPVAIVEPERERPGIVAAACAIPMMKASRYEISLFWRGLA